MLDEVTAEQFAEWAAFFTIEPQGWTAANLIQARIVTALVQPHSKKRIDERKLLLQTVRPAASLAAQRARLEAFAIQTRARFPDEKG